MRVLGILFALMAIDTSLEDSQDDEPEIVDPKRCKCGEKHGTKQSPNPRGTKDELMRLELVLIDNSSDFTSKSYSARKLGENLTTCGCVHLIKTAQYALVRGAHFSVRRRNYKYTNYIMGTPMEEYT